MQPLPDATPPLPATEPAPASPFARLARASGYVRQVGAGRAVRWLAAWVRQWALPVSLALLLIPCARQLLADLDPKSFWLDDIWVASLAKNASVLDLFRLKPPAPVGYLLTLMGVRAIFGSGQVALQSVAFAARMLAIPLLAWAAVRLTNRRLMGLAAAAVLAVNPSAADWGGRVKQYSSDILVTTVLLVLAVELFRAPELRRLTRLALASLAGVLFSFGAAFTGPLLVNVGGLAVALRNRGQPGAWKRVLARVGSFDAAALGIALWLLRHQKSGPMTDYWNKCFLPLHPISAALAYVWKGAGWQFLTGPFQSYGTLGAAMAGVGLVELVRRPRTRAVALFFALFYLQMLAASALKLYPLGEARIDSFGWPVTVLLASAGASVVLRRRRGLELLVGAAVLYFSITTVQATVLHYKAAGDRPVVEKLDQALTDQDALVVYPWANWSLAYYGPWPADLIPQPDSTNAFYAVPRRPKTLVLGEKVMKDPQLADAELKPFLAQVHRVFFFGTHAPAQRQDPVLNRIRLLGFHQVARTLDVNSQYLVFEH